jgi:hypothetical protein
MDNFFDDLAENEVVLFPVTEIINAHPETVKENHYMMDMNNIEKSVSEFIADRFPSYEHDVVTA